MLSSQLTTPFELFFKNLGSALNLLFELLGTEGTRLRREDGVAAGDYMILRALSIVVADVCNSATDSHNFWVNFAIRGVHFNDSCAVLPLLGLKEVFLRLRALY